MRFQNSIIELIEKRKSVRSYDPEHLIEDNKKHALVSCMSELSQEHFRFVMVETKAASDKGHKLGTYGMIKGANSFIVGLPKANLPENSTNCMDFGYALEHIILKATDLGLSTCWMVGTYNTEQFMKFAMAQADEQIGIVSPLGYGVEKQRAMEKVVRWMAKSSTRKSWEDLFFINDMQHPLTKDQAELYAIPLEMVRIAPSAVNYQPWRIIKHQDRYDFYMTLIDYKYTGKGFDSRSNDMGIAMCHFQLAAQELGLSGYWHVLDAPPTPSPEDAIYLSSWFATSS